jgi:hypothetical protein
MGNFIDQVFTVVAPVETANGQRFSWTGSRVPSKGQNNSSQSQSRAIIGTIKKDIIHVAAPERFKILLAHNLAISIYDIALTAVVRSHNRTNTED